MHLFTRALLLFAATSSLASAATPPTSSTLKLYTLDCGRIDFKDLRMFSDTGEYDNVPGKMVDTCFLIKHPKGNLLWDAGLSETIAEHKEGVAVDGGIRMYVDVPLQTQLKTIGLTPKDVQYIAFSHFHFDHTGNAGLFASATWILNKAELDAMNGPAPPFGVDPKPLAAYKTAHQQIINGDYDVFGDGSVMILRTPGHTPGHQVLLVRLPHAGNVILGGDLYHTRDNRTHRRVPPINTSRAETLASEDRVEHLAETLKARVIIQHDAQDIGALPKVPAYLE